jgi:hypothetical protein
MKKYKTQNLEFEEEEAFAGITDEKFNETMNELDRTIEKQMIENETAEKKSIKFAKEFISVS